MTLKIEIQTPGKMTQNGSGILRAMQNNNTPEADLLIRESIQNSLDAAKKSGPTVEVDYTIDEFNTKDLASKLEKIGPKLTKKYASTEKFLSIRDYHTTGLIGPLKHDDVENQNYGNLLKLVYDISKPQEKEGSGGSWGYGKTIYYRVGMGLVIYYSRIKLEGNSYGERLAVVLVENEQKKDTIIPKYKNRNATGVAWWGETVSENLTIPVTDSKKIADFLSIFDIKPYKKHETGTAVIIPFIDEDKILKDNAYGNTEGEERIDYYETLSDYFSYSIQRWYFPRLNNKAYKYGNKKELKVTINGHPIENEDQEEYFQLYANLYNYGVSSDKRYIQTLKKSNEIMREEIRLRDSRLASSTVGILVYGVFSYEDLGMGSIGTKNTPHFLSNLSQESKEVNEPIITYCRQPGMIINYEDRSIWTKNIPPTVKGQYLLGIFILESNNNLTLDEKVISLEEYIRQGEKADHTSWNDHSIEGINPNIVNRIQNNVVGKIKKQMEESIEKLETDNDGRLSNIISTKLLPPSGFGKKASTKRKRIVTSDKVSIGKSIVSNLHMSNIKYGENKITVPYLVEVTAGSINSIDVEIKIDKEGAPLPIDKYELDLSTSPLSLQEFHLFSNNKMVMYPEDINDVMESKTDLGTVYKLTIPGPFIKGEKLTGEIVVGVQSINLRPVISISVGVM